MAIIQSLRSAFGAARKVHPSNFWLLIALGAVQVLLMAVMKFLFKGVPSSDILLVPIEFALFSLYTMWSTSVALQALKSKKVSIQSLVTAFDGALFIQLMLANLLFTVGGVIGMILFIVPGIVFGISAMVFNFALVHERLSALDAIKRSFQLMKGHRMNFFLGSVAFTILLFMVVGIGMALAQFFAVLPTVSALAMILVQILGWLLSPLAVLMLGHYYLQLRRAAGRKRTA